MPVLNLRRPAGGGRAFLAVVTPQMLRLLNIAWKQCRRPGSIDKDWAPIEHPEELQEATGWGASNDEVDETTEMNRPSRQLRFGSTKTPNLGWPCDVHEVPLYIHAELKGQSRVREGHDEGITLSTGLVPLDAEANAWHPVSAKLIVLGKLSHPSPGVWSGLSA